MQLCRSCYVPMVGVMSFSKSKHEKFYRCQKCCGETKHQRIENNELDFEDVLHKENERNCR